MYWLFFMTFILAILVPDIVNQQAGGFPEEKIEEALIFVLGSIAFLTFIFKERQLAIEREEKEEKRRELERAGKDLISSYNYIGQVNRKMDILMDVALGFANRGMLDRKDEKESYRLIVDAALFIMQADAATLRFVNVETGRMEKNVEVGKDPIAIRNEDLTGMSKNINIKEDREIFVAASHNKIKGVKSYLIIKGGGKNEILDQKNAEILKVLASRGLFFFSFFSSFSTNGNSK